MRAAFVVLALLMSIRSGELLADDTAKLRFEAQTIDDKVQIGYGVAIGDVNGDGKPDVLMADKKQFVWYENPSWRRHVMVENLTVRDNVCIAARDINGDGKVEIAVGAEWNPGDTVNSGSVHYLVPPEDRRQRWRPIKLHNEPVIHRMRWVRVEKDRYQLVVSPLHGKGNRGGEGEGVRLLAYDVPEDVDGEWKTTVIEDSMHVTHNLDPCEWIADNDAEEILYLGREGAMLLWRNQGSWMKTRIARVEGGGEIRCGVDKSGRRFLVTIQPLHGDRLVYYPSAYDGKGDDHRTTLSDRQVLDDAYQGGHAIAIADLSGNGSPEIVAGWRLPNREKKVGVKYYYRDGDAWRSQWIDDNTMATEDIRIGDLDADGRPDIVAAGRATKNLKIYWNRRE